MTDRAAPGRVLLVDDDPLLCEFLEQALGRQGFTVASDTSAEDALTRLGTEEFDVVVTDVGMAGLDGLAFLARVLELRPGLPVVLVTGVATTSIAITALQLGAWDLLIKPVNAELLAATLERARRHRALTLEVARLQALVPAPGRHHLVCGSEPMKKVDDLVARLGQSDAAVLIVGESGTGKELVAAALHAGSPRHAGPFIAINCAAVPATLLESELFGHVRGAFTDAHADRVGLFVQANGGTLFLDEIGELPLELQPRLLRALQERRVRPVGGTAEVAFTGRLVSATNRDLKAAVHERRFREDLYYRINVVRIDMPPLRDRTDDILPLAQHFIRAAAQQSGKPVRGLSAEAAQTLLAYAWPGNVRELENCIASAVALARFDEVSVDDLPLRVRPPPATQLEVTAETVEDLVTLEVLGQRYLQRALVLLGGNKSHAAQALGVDRRTLYRMLERLGPPAPEPPP